MEENLDVFAEAVVMAVNRQIMDRICKEFKPSFIVRHVSGEVSVALLDSYPSSEEEEKRLMSSMAEQAARAEIRPTACALAVMFRTTPEDDDPLMVMLISLMSPDRSTRSCIMSLDCDEDGVLSIRKTVMVPEEKSYGIFRAPERLLSAFYDALRP